MNEREALGPLLWYLVFQFQTVDILHFHKLVLKAVVCQLNVVRHLKQSKLATGKKKLSELTLICSCVYIAPVVEHFSDIILVPTVYTIVLFPYK